MSRYSFTIERMRETIEAFQKSAMFFPIRIAWRCGRFRDRVLTPL
jgi:hypothetical protein